jgi:PAS domain S-box-containing protein
MDRHTGGKEERFFGKKSYWLRLLLSEVSDLAFLCDSAAKLSFLNEPFRKLVSPGHICLGRPFAALFPEKERKQAESACARALSGAEAECELPLGLTSFVFRIKPLFESNKVHGLLGVGQAAPSSCTLSSGEKHACAFALEELIQTRTTELIITNERLLGEMLERKRAEKAFRESEKKYGSMLEAAHDAIFVADASTGAIIHANSKASKLVGRPLEELKGLHQSALHSEEDAEHYKAMFRERVRLGVPFTGGIQYVRHRDGRKIPVRIGTSLATSENRVVVHGIFRELSKNPRNG